MPDLKQLSDKRELPPTRAQKLIWLSVNGKDVGLLKLDNGAHLWLTSDRGRLERDEAEQRMVRYRLAAIYMMPAPDTVIPFERSIDPNRPLIKQLSIVGQRWIDTAKKETQNADA